MPLHKKTYIFFPKGCDAPSWCMWGKRVKRKGVWWRVAKVTATKAVLVEEILNPIDKKT